MGCARPHGFSLIELLMAVVVFGILTVLLFPAWQDSIRAARRSDAQQLLFHTAQRLESCRDRFFAYNTNTCDVTFPATSEEGHYTVTVARTPTSFTLTATPQGRQSADVCSTLTLNNLGVQGASGASAKDCW